MKINPKSNNIFKNQNEKKKNIIYGFKNENIINNDNFNNKNNGKNKFKMVEKLTRNKNNKVNKVNMDLYYSGLDDKNEICTCYIF